MESNNARFQSFRTTDAVSVFMLFACVATVFGAILSEMLRDDRPGRAHLAAEALATQIRIQRETALQGTNTSGRAPASVLSSMLTSGTLGKDPWGRPFRYHVLNGLDGRNSLIFVWSDGPNGVPESMEFVKESVHIERPDGFRFKGDDLGQVQASL